MRISAGFLLVALTVTAYLAREEEAPPDRLSASKPEAAVQIHLGVHVEHEQDCPCGASHLHASEQAPESGLEPFDLAALSPEGAPLQVRESELLALRGRSSDASAQVRLGDARVLRGRVTMAVGDAAEGWWMRSLALEGYADAVLIVEEEVTGELRAEIFSPSSSRAFRMRAKSGDVRVFEVVARTELVPDCFKGEAPVSEDAATQFFVDKGVQLVPVAKPSGRSTAEKGGGRSVGPVLRPGTGGGGDTEPPEPPETTSVYALQSMPGAEKVVYLDFDGEVVSGTYWNAAYNGGAPIHALPMILQEEGIRTLWMAVSEDFRPFTVNITTDRSVYDATPIHQRLMVVYAINGGWFGNVGGIANYNSFGSASRGVCWAFTTRPSTGSHEIGHTCNLTHDGTVFGAEYYWGHGDAHIHWTPIMGSSNSSVTAQWDNGSYSSANNSQDDLAVLTSWLGRREDDYGDTTGQAGSLSVSGGVISHRAFIHAQEDVDLFRFNLSSAGAIRVEAIPYGSEWALNFDNGTNLDVELSLLNASGGVMQVVNPDTGFAASLEQELSAGTYYLQVRGVGRPGAVGYSGYGSIGRYTLSGALFAGSPPDLRVQPNAMTVEMAEDEAAVGSFTLYNTGDHELTVSSLSVPDYVTLASSVSRLPPRGSVEVSYTIQPEGLVWGTNPGRLQITSNDWDEPFLSVPMRAFVQPAAAILHQTTLSAPMTYVVGRDEGPLSPYPSEQTIEDLEGEILEAKVLLSGLSHDWVEILTLVLVAPGGEKLLLFSNNGGAEYRRGMDVAFMAGEHRPQLLDDLQSGVYRLSASSAYPMPGGPDLPYANTFEDLVGTSPNGNWLLYGHHDIPTPQLGFQLDGWILEFLLEEPAMSFARWLADYSGDLGDAESDPDGDGLNNLLEYALGSNPLERSQEALPHILLSEVEGASYLTLDVQRLEAREDLTYVVEVSADLLNWESGAGKTLTLEDRPDALVVRDIQPIVAGADRYIRLRVIEL